VVRKTRRATSEEERKVFAYLNNQLASHREGEVVSLLVYDGHGKINCYGERIDEDFIFTELNLSIGAHGSHATGTIAYPSMHRLTSYQKGNFSPAQRFGIPAPNAYVALVNITMNPDEKAMSFP